MAYGNSQTLAAWHRKTRPERSAGSRKLILQQFAKSELVFDMRISQKIVKIKEYVHL